MAMPTTGSWALTGIRGALRRRAFAAGTALLACLAQPAAADEPVRIKVVGGHASVMQYRQYEEPFWTKRVMELSGGRLSATVKPFDHSGLRGQDMLQLMRLGVVPFGTALLSLVSADEPELVAVDLPALNPTLADIRATVADYRPHLDRVLKQRHGIELLGVYAYPAQVIYCTKAFKGLSDLSGRRVRTSSVGQSELVSGLGGVPVLVPFTDLVGAVKQGVVDCAITGTRSGAEIGLSEITTHIHAMALTWGVAIFGANQTAWAALPDDLRTVIRRGVADLEREIWDAADRETALGLACNTGSSTCAGKPGRMVLVPVSEEDERQRRRLLAQTVLPSWLDRCGEGCVAVWNEFLAPRTGIRLGAE